MKIKKVIIENFENIEHFEVNTNGKIFLIQCKDDENAYSFLDAIVWGLNMYLEYGLFSNLLYQDCYYRLITEESKREEIKISIILDDDGKEVCLTKIAVFEDCAEFKETKFFINQEEVEFTVYSEFCTKYYNYCFKYLSFILNKNLESDFYGTDLFVQRMMNLQNFCDVEKEREQINRVAKNFKITSKQLHLEINEDLIPHWYRSKSGIYLNGHYSESENVLRKAYYILALNRYISKKHNRNLPVFLDIINKMDYAQIVEFISKLAEVNIPQIFIVSKTFMHISKDFELIEI